MKADLHISNPLFHAAYVSRPADWAMSNLHYHEAYEIRVLEKGHHQYMLNNTLFDVHPFDCVMHKPNVLHKSHNTNGFTRIGIYFTHTFLDKYFSSDAQKILLSCFEQQKITLEKENFNNLKTASLAMLKQDIKKDDNSIFIYLSYILNILNESKSNEIKENSTKNNIVNMILSYINENYSTITNIDEIAKAFYISKYHLCRIFKESTGMTIIPYLNQIRIRNACIMLKNTTMSITEIGEKCGFNSTIYFCNTFKKIQKESPTEYRKSFPL